MGSKTIYFCDLCSREFTFRDHYSPNSSNDGLLLLTGTQNWQRVRTIGGQRFDICQSCALLFSRASQLQFSYPIRVIIDFGDLPFENDIRALLDLPPNPIGAEIVRLKRKEP